MSGLTFDAGTTNSPTLMSVGRAGVHTDHAANPISLQDVFFRIGSSVQGLMTLAGQQGVTICGSGYRSTVAAGEHAGHGAHAQSAALWPPGRPAPS